MNPPLMCALCCFECFLKSCDHLRARCSQQPPLHSARDRHVTMLVAPKPCQICAACRSQVAHMSAPAGGEAAALPADLQAPLCATLAIRCSMNWSCGTAALPACMKCHPQTSRPCSWRYAGDISCSSASKQCTNPTTVLTCKASRAQRNEFLCLQVHSLDKQLRNSPQGYGHLCFAQHCAGNASHSITTWRPAPTQRERVDAWFVGGGPSLKHLDFVARPGASWGQTFQGKPMNKMCTTTETTGRVTVRTACVVQYPKPCAPNLQHTFCISEPRVASENPCIPVATQD